MAGLYRYFISIAAISISLTLLVSLLPHVTLFDKRDEIQTILNQDIQFKKFKSRDSKRHIVKLPEVWNANRDFDRIITQMNFKPKFKSNRRINIHLEQNFDVNEGTDIFMEQECEVQNCAILLNAKQGQKIDARLFKQDADFMGMESLLQQIPRTRDQIWIMFILESPLASPDYFLLDAVYNWTATYRRDSTIVTPYERWETSSTKKHINIKNYAKGKTKQVAIFVSNCNSINNRLNFVKELSSYIGVDVYGGCGNLTCTRETENACFELLKKKYKFYLAFENSNCRDYITEKFFRNALMSDVLPIVMGAHPDDYRKVAPPNSYIHVEDFKSPKDLAAYLHKLDENDTLYNEYFKWKGTGSFINTKFWCRLCAMLNDPNKPELIVENMESWWRPPKICLRPGQRWTDIE